MASGIAQFEYDPEKFREAVLYIAKKCENDSRFGATKLNKILYYADFAAYRRLGAPITGAAYRKLDQGPAPRQLPRERRTMLDVDTIEIEERPYFHGVQHRIVAKRPPNIERFSTDEIAILDEVIEGLWHLSATQVSDLSHREWGWQVAEPLEDIPYPAAWLSAESLDEVDIHVGRAIAESNGLLVR